MSYVGIYMDQGAQNRNKEEFNFLQVLSSELASKMFAALLYTVHPQAPVLLLFDVPCHELTMSAKDATEKQLCFRTKCD